MTITIHMAWWFRFYVAGMILAVRTMHTMGIPAEPDWDKIKATAKRAIRIRTH